jgi:hypothetical protein
MPLTEFEGHLAALSRMYQAPRAGQSGTETRRYVSKRKKVPHGR